MTAPTVPPADETTNKMFNDPMMTKLGVVFLLFLLLQVPLMMVNGVMEERQMYNVEYPKDYKGPGVGPQTVIGPVLAVPYRYQSTEEKIVATEAPTAVGQPGAASQPATTTRTEKIVRPQIGYLHFFPENLSIQGHLTPEIRDEGKFKSILYSTALTFKGTFNTQGFDRPTLHAKDLMWDQAFIALGISDLRGIRKETHLNWGSQQTPFIPGANGLKLFDTGQHASVTGVKGNSSYPFSFVVSLNGSRDLNVFPAGKENKITLASSWAEPTFTGGFLPTQKTIGPNGFDALWEVSYFSRNLPQVWSSQEPELKNSLAQYMVGTTLATPVEFYRTAIRAVKYGSLFVVMTFLAFFIFERMTQLRIHEVQYLLVGLALCLFFLLLVALSEWMPFVLAYVAASIATIVQITWYTQAFHNSANPHLWKMMAGLLVGLYIYLYVLLQLEDFSLLIGSVGLFVVLTLVMYVTRNIDWYRGQKAKITASETSKALQ